MLMAPLKGNINHKQIIFLDHSITIYFFPLGIGHEVQREGKECEECQEEVNRILGEGKKSGIINFTLLYDDFF